MNGDQRRVASLLTLESLLTSDESSSHEHSGRVGTSLKSTACETRDEEDEKERGQNRASMRAKLRR